MEGFIDFEILLTTLMQNLGSWLGTPMQAFTFLGSEIFFLLIMPAIFWCIDPVIGFRAGMMLVISGGLNTALKMFFHTPRPFWVDRGVKAFSSETSFGLPSGHSQNSAAIWGMVGHGYKKRYALIIAAVLVFLIGISRIYLGVHFLHDVLSGWLVGILIIILYNKAEKPIANFIKPKSLGYQLIAALVFSLLFVGLGLLAKTTSNTFSLPAEWISNAVAAGAEKPDPYNLEGMITIAGVALGFLAGFTLWRFKYGIYKIECTPLKRLSRYFLGLIGIFLLYFGLKVIFPEEPQLLGLHLRYIRYSLIGFWVTFFAPWLFKRLHLE